MSPECVENLRDNLVNAHPARKNDTTEYAAKEIHMARSRVVISSQISRQCSNTRVRKFMKI